MPVVASSGSPACGVPRITGGSTLLGGTAAPTGPIAAEAALADPIALPAVTTTRTVEPTSAPTST